MLLRLAVSWIAPISARVNHQFRLSPSKCGLFWEFTQAAQCEMYTKTLRGPKGNRVTLPPPRMDITEIFRMWTQVKLPVQPGTALRRNWDTIDCLTSHVSEYRTVRGLWKNREFPAFLKYPQCSSPRRENAFSLRHVGDAHHVGDGRVYPVFIWIRHNWIGAS